MTTRQDLVSLLDILNATIQSQECELAQQRVEISDLERLLREAREECLRKFDQITECDEEIVRLRQEKDDAGFVARKWEEECERIRRLVNERYPFAFVGMPSDDYETDRSYDPTDDMPTDDVHGIPDDVLDEMSDCVPKG